MSKHAIITCGYPLSGKTQHYHSNYKEYSYISTDNPSKNTLEDFKKIASSSKNIYLDGRNPRKDDRDFYVDFLKKQGFSVYCLWFTVPFEGILFHSFDIQNFQKRNQFISQAYAFRNAFSIPSTKEHFTAIKKVPLLPERLRHGREKALFLSINGIFAERNQRGKKLEPYSQFRIFDTQFSDLIHAYRNNGYRIIIVPSKMLPYVEEGEVLQTSRKILTDAKIPFTDIVFDKRNGAQFGTTRIAYPEVITKVSQRYGIDLTQSIMVGTEPFERALSMISGCKYYFHRDVFFESEEYVTMTLKGKTNDTNY